MKAIHLKAFGAENLVLTDVETPDPQPHEIRVRVEAVSLNYLDVAIVKGFYNPKIALPRIPVSDGAGVVDAVGSQVTKWKKGDRVMTHFYQKWIGGRSDSTSAASQVAQASPGVLSEYTILPEDGVVSIPAYLTSEEAATLPIAGLTAWAGLFDHANLKPGETILTQGTGGVSVFALQLAKTAGARVIATSSSDTKLERLKALGADEVINYKTKPAWHEEVVRLTHNAGVDAILDVGGAATISSSLLSVKRHGFIGTVGFLGGPVLSLDFFRMVQYGIRVQGFSVASRQSFESFTNALSSTELRPVVDRVFSLDETQQAFQYLEAGNFVGKVVIRI